MFPHGVGGSESQLKISHATRVKLPQLLPNSVGILVACYSALVLHAFKACNGTHVDSHVDLAATTAVIVA
jgi:hypothetical protein